MMVGSYSPSELITNGNDANRTKNMEITTSTLDGTIVKAGETFSFCNTVGPATSSKGYLKADIYEIRPITPYPEAYNATVDLAREQLRQNARPAIQKDVPDLSQYSAILLGTPNWWSHVAMPVFTFMDQNDLSGKVVLPFVSHGGGGMSGCEHDIRNKYPKADVPKQLPSKEGRFLLTKHELFHPLPLRISSQWGYR